MAQDDVIHYNALVDEAARIGLEGFRRVNRFENKVIAAKRIERLASWIRARMEGLAAADKQEQQMAQTEKEGTQEQMPRTPTATAMKKERIRRTPPSSQHRANGGFGKPARKIGDFVPVRPDTDRARVIEAVKPGKLTLDQLAAKLGMPKSKVNMILFCMSRDNGIGYYKEEDRIMLEPPGSLTVDNLVKVAAPPAGPAAEDKAPAPKRRRTRASREAAA